MTIRVEEERPGKTVVAAVVGGTFEEFEIRKVETGELHVRFDYWVDDLLVNREVYLAALETSRSNRIVLSEDDDGGPIEAVPTGADSVH